MNKFIIEKEILPNGFDSSQPSLYKVYFGGNGKYYLHKGKTLYESVDRLLDDIYRGIRSKTTDKQYKYPEIYEKAIDYCIKYPAIHKVTIEVVLNAEPDKILRKEDAMYKAMKKDDNILNDLETPPYKPEWMIKQALQKRCDACIPFGVVKGKKLNFKFCPNCGRFIKK